MVLQNLCRLALVALASFHIPGQFSDLRSDWQPPQNPNGSWSYIDGQTGTLLTYQCWAGCTSPPRQDAYCRGTGVDPAVYRQETAPPLGRALHDIMLRPGGNVTLPVIVRWTALQAGTVNILGGTWLDCGAFQPSMSWTIVHQSGATRTVLATGGWPGGCGRSCPTLFCYGQVTAGSLSRVQVQAGDAVDLVCTHFGLHFQLSAACDFSVSYVGTPGVGQANSCFGTQNAAQLSFGEQRTGATPGPWPVLLTPGTSITMTVCGQSNAPYTVFAGSQATCSFSAPILGCIDIGPPLVPLFSGALPSSGILATPIPVPLGLPPGFLFRVQGAVLHPGAGTTPTATAAFDLQV